MLTKIFAIYTSVTPSKWHGTNFKHTTTASFEVSGVKYSRMFAFKNVSDHLRKFWSVEVIVGIFQPIRLGYRESW
jgi:hypothetical protein